MVLVLLSGLLLVVMGACGWGVVVLWSVADPIVGVLVAVAALILIAALFSAAGKCMHFLWFKATWFERTMALVE